MTEQPVSEPVQSEENSVPAEDAEVFRGLRSLALQSMSVLIREAEEIQTKIKESKTKPKKDLYTKRFNKVKNKFQDEVARLTQIEHTMKENGIPFEVEEEDSKDE